jgi:hypothetical protein
MTDISADAKIHPMSGSIPEKRKLRYELLCAWCGIIFSVGYTLSLSVFNQFVPPASPNLSAVELTRFYMEHRDGIKLGSTLGSVFGAFLLPWTALVSIQMARIEGSWPVLSVLQGIANAVSALIFSLIPLFWIAIVYRDNPNPEIVLALNDLSWILFCVGYPVTTFAFLAIGIVGLNDANTPRLFPPWLCYFTMFTGLIWVFNDAIPYTKTGPLAWDGLVTYYVLFTCWLGGHFLMAIYTILEVRRRITAG